MLGLTHDEHPTRYRRWPVHSGARVGRTRRFGQRCRNSPTRVFIGTDWEQVCAPNCQLEIIRTSKLHHQVKP